MASLKGTKALKRIGKFQSSSEFTGPRQRHDSPAHDHGKTPVAGRLHPINNVKQRINQPKLIDQTLLSLILKELGGAAPFAQRTSDYRDRPRHEVVEPIGIEPTTSSLQS